MDLHEHVAALFAADVVELEHDNERLAHELAIYREMVSVLLDISHQALVRILTLSARQ